MIEKVFTADLHTHLLEKNTKPEDYWKYAKKRKLDAIAMTEHAEFRPEKAFEIAKKTKPKNILLIPGIELNTDIGHVLVYAENERVFQIPELRKKGIEIEKVIEIGKENKLLVSIAHPWGFSHDSAAYIFGEKKLEKLVEENSIGVEAFNGMIGQLAYFVYNSKWVSRPRNFFEKLETNKIAKKIRISKIGEKARKKIDSKSMEIVERTRKAIELGEKAGFITAGSDAHSAVRIGAGIIKMRLPEQQDNTSFLKALREKKNIEWAGPLIKEKKDSIEIVQLPRKKMEALQALKYAAKTKLHRKVQVKE
ncbi:MAG: PHP domain-containing protein [Candidatus Diapherotrites archaeon]|nr:PHP domain-containing protein [Candidatus Diapherotrites archaeon]